MSDAIVIPLSAVAQRHTAAVGAKAANLARLIRDGLRVPGGFCLTTAAYRRHLERPEIRPYVEPASGPGGDDAPLAALRAAITATPVEDEVAAALAGALRDLGPGPLAVRSSAAGEDSPRWSFAGQHETVLGVTGLDDCLSAVRRCWASAWSERACAYRARHGLGALRVEMAVLVQRLVAADVSGVLFTADPRGRSRRIVVEAAPGLGETVVSGRAQPDHLELSRDDLSVLCATAGRKPSKLVARPGGGVEAQPVAAADSQRLCLDHGTAAQLAKLALRAEAVLRSPLDLEWAIAGGELHLLQARPITATAAPPREDRQVWTNANAAEVLPDVVTPMTWSVVKPLVSDLFGTLAELVGIDLSRVTLVELIAGRAYFNAGALAGLARHMPGAGSRSLTMLLGGRQDAAAAVGEIGLADEDIPDLRPSRLRTCVSLPRVALGLAVRTPGRGRRFVERLRAQTDAWRRAPWRELADEPLLRRVRFILDGMVQLDALLYAGLGLMYTLALYNVCRRWLPGGDATASRLLAGLGGMDNAEAALELWRLARFAHDRPAVAAALSSGPGFGAIRQALSRAQGGAEFLRLFEAFLHRHGHHARGEVELANARWSETPEYVLDIVRGYVHDMGAGDPRQRARRVTEQRAALDRECRRRLRNPFKNLIFRFVHRQARRAAPLRENFKSELVRRLALVRLMLLELGRRLAGRGVLERADDVFFLRLEELEAVVRGATEPAAAALVADRRAEHRRNLALTPPDLIVGRFEPGEAAPPVAAAADTEVLRGIAVSPGTVTGPARVILSAGNDRVRPGEILVAPCTDPGWTPYFVNAAAIVMDLGGMLSHGSIVAREYGIPCVVNVGPATKLIETGRMLRVDGDAGSVTVVGGREEKVESRK